MDNMRFIEGLILAEVPQIGHKVRIRAIPDGAKVNHPGVPDPSVPAVVNGGSLISFVAGLSLQEVRDVLYSVQLAQRGASGEFNRFEQTRQWYYKYSEILARVGWVGEQLAFKEHNQSSGKLEMAKEALDVIAAIATSQQLDILMKSLDALRKLSATDKPITIFEYNALTQASGNFQVGTVQKAGGLTGPVSMGLGGFYFHAGKQEGRFLVFSWGGKSISFWAAVQKMTLNTVEYARHRDLIEQKLGAQATAYLSALDISP
jgi:hypothetical protein